MSINIFKKLTVAATALSVFFAGAVLVGCDEVSVTIHTSGPEKPSGGFFTDTRDGKKYKAVKIGGKTWMAQNLNYASDSSWCYNNNAANCTVYGRLYNWTSAMDIGSEYLTKTWSGSDVKHQGICPKGWRLPNDSDWDALITAVGGNMIAGYMLKSESGWNNYQEYSGNGRDEYGFSALPGGHRNSSGSFYDVGNAGSLWSATEHDANNAWHLSLSRYGNIREDNNKTAKSNGIAVRCIY